MPPVIRRRLGWDEDVRKRIDSNSLLVRLQAHALSKHDLMSPSQVSAAFGLLRKVLPDLMTLQIDDRKEINHVIRFEWLPPDAPEPHIIDGEVLAPTRDLENPNGASTCFADAREAQDGAAATSPSEHTENDKQASANVLEAPESQDRSERSEQEAPNGSQKVPIGSDSSFDDDIIDLPCMPLVPRSNRSKKR